MGRLEGLVFVRWRPPETTLQSPGISLCSVGAWGSVGVGAFPLPSPDVPEGSCRFFGEGFRGTSVGPKRTVREGCRRATEGSTFCPSSQYCREQA